MPTVTLNFKLTKEDYFNFSYHTNWQAAGKKKATIKQRLKHFLYFGGLMVLVKLTSAGAFFDFYLLFSLFVLASIFVLPLFNVKSDTLKQANKVLADPLNSDFLRQTEYVLSETGISTKNTFGEARYNWAAIVKKEETNVYFFLYLNSIQAFIIPKRIIVAEETRLKLQNLLAQHISFEAEVGHLVKD